MTTNQRGQQMTKQEAQQVFKELSAMMALEESTSLGKRIAYAKKFKKEQREREQKQQ